MIETARKEDLFLDKKLIIPENRLDAIRIMARLHPVVGDQPTNEKDQPNTNNPVLDLACTILNIHESGIGVHADLRKIQNEPPKYFYGKGFMSGISSLKGNGILAVYGQWRDASGRYAIKQFYYTDKEILWRNSISDTAWSAWFDVLTGNSDLDYNKLLNVPLTSTLSDDKTKIASIFAVNNVNRAAVNAQKIANEAHALTQTKQDKLNFTGNGPEVMKVGAFGIGGMNGVGSDFDILNWSQYNTGHSWFYAYNSINRPSSNGSFYVNKSSDAWGTILYISDAGETFINKKTPSGFDGWKKLYSEVNTTVDQSGFIRKSGSADAVITTDIATKLKVGITRLDSSLSDAEDRAATPMMVNDVNRAASTAQKTANSAYSLAQSKQDKLTFVGDGSDVVKTGAGGLINAVVVRDRDIADISLYKSGFESFYAVRSINRPIESDGVLWSSFNPEKTYGTVLYSATNGRIFQIKIIAGKWEDWQELYTTGNTTIDKSGFVRAFGSKDTMTTDMLPPSTLFFFDTKTVPSGFLELAGQAISKDKYPILYAEFGSKLPNRRDRYFRAAGGSRAGAAGTLQDDAIRNISGRFTSRPSDASTGVGAITNAIGAFTLNERSGADTRPFVLQGGGVDLSADYVNFDASRAVPTANENRPYSVSVLVCVRAQ